MSAENKLVKRSFVAVAALTGVALVIAFGLALLDQTTRERIAANYQAYEMRQLKDILQGTEYDNDIFRDFVLVTSSQPDAPLLGPGDNHAIFRVTAAGQPRAAILQVTADHGYSGVIELLVGIFADGTLAGVRVTKHRETPGLGDLIEAEKSPWIHQFTHHALGQPPENDWKVKKDGGAFDQITGATVTPRAVVSAVRDALLYFRAHQNEIFSAPQALAHGASSAATAPLASAAKAN